MRECPKASTRPPLAMCTGGPLEGIGILIRAWAACAVGFTCHFLHYGLGGWVCLGVYRNIGECNVVGAIMGMMGVPRNKSQGPLML